MSMGPSLTHILAGQEGRKGDSAWAASQQERWVYPVCGSAHSPGPVHVGAGGTTQREAAAALACPAKAGESFQVGWEEDEAMVMTRLWVCPSSCLVLGNPAGQRPALHRQTLCKVAGVRERSSHGKVPEEGAASAKSLRLGCC